MVRSARSRAHNSQKYHARIWQHQREEWRKNGEDLYPKSHGLTIRLWTIIFIVCFSLELHQMRQFIVFRTGRVYICVFTSSSSSNCKVWACFVSFRFSRVCVFLDLELECLPNSPSIIFSNGIIAHLDYSTRWYVSVGDLCSQCEAEARLCKHSRNRRAIHTHTDRRWLCDLWLKNKTGAAKYAGTWCVSLNWTLNCLSIFNARSLTVWSLIN